MVEVPGDVLRIALVSMGWKSEPPTIWGKSEQKQREHCNSALSSLWGLFWSLSLSLHQLSALG